MQLLGLRALGIVKRIEKFLLICWLPFIYRASFQFPLSLWRVLVYTYGVFEKSSNKSELFHKVVVGERVYAMGNLLLFTFLVFQDQIWTKKEGRPQL